MSQTYDDLGRVLTRSYPTGGVRRELGLHVRRGASDQLHHQLGIVRTYAYDSAGRKTNEVRAAGTRYSFADNGLLNAEDGPWSK